jgi:hypothetical protein
MAEMGVYDPGLRARRLEHGREGVSACPSYPGKPRFTILKVKFAQTFEWQEQPLKKQDQRGHRGGLPQILL